MRVSSNSSRITASERIRQIEDYLHTIRTKSASPVHPLWNLRALHDECKHTGQEDLSELCTQLESRVIELQMTCGVLPESLLAEMLGMTHSIRQRVDRVAGQVTSDGISLDKSSDVTRALA